MAISIVCPGCKKRFKVSDKFAGKKGPCPKCKTQINIPEKADDVVVHAPESFGPKDKAGRPALKPIARKEAKFSPIMAGIIGGVVLLVFIVAWMLRSPDGNVHPILLVIGAIGLAPPLAWSAYSFLRDAELEPFRGVELLIRLGACSAVYVILWGLVALISGYVLDVDISELEVIHWAFILPVMIVIGSFAAYASLDLEMAIGGLHYGMYLVVTFVLLIVLGVLSLGA